MLSNYKVHLAVFTLLVLSIACGQIEIGVENTQESNFAAPLNDPTDGDLPIDCQMDDYPIYINKVYGYCLAYPEDFFVASESDREVEIHGPAVGGGIEPVNAALIINVQPRQADLTLREQAEGFLDEFSVVDHASLNWTEVEIDGKFGWRVEPIPVYLSWRIIFTESNGYLYHLMFWPIEIEETAQDLADLYQVSTQTFRFLD